MSRIPCNVNKDLLPLYVDDVCSEESKSMVEEHLAGCEKCQEYYEALKEGIPEEKIAEEKEGLLSEEKMREAAVSVIKATKKEITKSQTIKAAGIVAAVILALIVLEGLDGSYMGGWLGKIPLFDIRLKVDDVRVTEVYELDNGYLYVTVEPDKKCGMCYAGNLQEVYDKKEGYTGVYEGFFGLESAPLDFNAIPIKRVSYVYPLSGKERGDYGELEVRENSAIYLEGKGGEKLEIWKKGQEVEPAPPEIEGKAKKAIDEELKRAREWTENNEMTAEEAEELAGEACVIIENEENKNAI